MTFGVDPAAGRVLVRLEHHSNAFAARDVGVLVAGGVKRPGGDQQIERVQRRRRHGDQRWFRGCAAARRSHPTAAARPVRRRSPPGSVSDHPWRWLLSGAGANWAVLGCAVPGENVVAEVVLRITPHTVHVVGVVLGVVELDQRDGPFNAEVMRLVDPVRSGPDEVQIILTGSADTVHLPADLLRLEPQDERLQQSVEGLPLVCSHGAAGRAPGADS